MHIAILIPVFNGLNFTTKCLSGIDQQLHGLKDDSNIFKIIVIDDGSTDGTGEWILENYPNIELLRGDGNLWWSGGINKGCHHAMDNLGCDYVLWWNNDIRADNNYFRNLLNIVKETSAGTIVGSKIYFADQPDLIWSMGGIFNSKSGYKRMTGYKERDSGEFNKVVSADWLPGMGTLIHRSVFEKIGFVNEKDFPQYHGDSDFTYRAKLSGFEIIVNPALKIWNDKSKSGIQHNNNTRKFFQSLFSIRSNNHIGKDVLFYRKYATSPFAYSQIIKKYFLYIGGFIKWKALSLIGVEKKHIN